MQFLKFTGDFKKISNSRYNFYYDDGNFESESEPIFIVPPIYDVSFKKIFPANNIGLESAKDFFNSLLFPKSQSIIELKCVEKEITSNSHLKNDEGTLILDNAYIAKIKYFEKDKQNIKILKEKEVLIDFEMESRYQSEKYTYKYFNYATGLRNQNNYRETWVIALCVNRSKKPKNEKTSKSYMTKKYKYDGNKDLDYVQIYEIYLNDLYSQLDKNISIFEGEEIQEIGKEWIKLFTIELWAKCEKDSMYCIPSNLAFKGKYIKRAIRLLSDISGELNLRISVEKDHQEKFQEELKEQFDDCYQTAYQKGKNDGKNDANLELLDSYFNMLKKGEQFGRILLLKKITFSFLKERYGDCPNFLGFYRLLLDQNWIIN